MRYKFCGEFVYSLYGFGGKVKQELYYKLIS